jgi:hypothetical protein
MHSILFFKCLDVRSVFSGLIFLSIALHPQGLKKYYKMQIVN